MEKSLKAASQPPIANGQGPEVKGQPRLAASSTEFCAELGRATSSISMRMNHPPIHRTRCPSRR